MSKTRYLGGIFLSSALAIAAGYWSGVTGNSVASGAEGEGVDVLKDWRYPGDRLLGSFSTRTGRSVSQPRIETQQAQFITDDPIEKVVSHFEKKIGVKPGTKGVINIGEVSEKPVVVSIQDDMDNRTRRVWIFNKYEDDEDGGVATNLVINSDAGKTQIAILRFKKPHAIKIIEIITCVIIVVVGRRSSAFCVDIPRRSVGLILTANEKKPEPGQRPAPASSRHDCRSRRESPRRPGSARSCGGACGRCARGRL
jgi:hypothetical protein